MIYSNRNAYIVKWDMGNEELKVRYPYLERIITTNKNTKNIFILQIYRIARRLFIDQIDYLDIDLNI